MVLILGETLGRPLFSQAYLYTGGMELVIHKTVTQDMTVLQRAGLQFIPDLRQCCCNTQHCNAILLVPLSALQLSSSV